MGLSASIILDTRYYTKKGYAIRIRFQQRYISLDEYSEAEHWSDKNSNVTPQHPEYRRLHPKLNRRAKDLQLELDYCFDNNLDQRACIEILKKGLKDPKSEEFALQRRLDEIRNSSSIGLIEFFDIRIQEKAHLGQSRDHYINGRDAVKRYLDKRDVRLNGLTYEWLLGFIGYTLSNGAQQGGVNAYLRSMKAVYKEAQKRKSLGIKQDNPFLGLIKSTGKKEVISLKKKQILKLRSIGRVKFQSGRSAFIQQRYAHLWLLQFVLGGHDLVDVALMTWKSIKQGRWKFQRYKNRSKPGGGEKIDNILLPLAKQFIELYGDPGSTRVFTFIPDPKSEPERYKFFRSNYNRSLKTISNRLGFDRHITSKSTRYIFRSRAGKLMIHDLVVNQLMGHKSSGVSFNYQGTLPKKVKDKGLRKIVGFLGNDLD